jgi:hypothetical protein
MRRPIVRRNSKPHRLITSPPVFESSPEDLLQSHPTHFDQAFSGGGSPQAPGNFHGTPHIIVNFVE